MGLTASLDTFWEDNHLLLLLSIKQFTSHPTCSLITMLTALLQFQSLGKIFGYHKGLSFGHLKAETTDFKLCLSCSTNFITGVNLTSLH